ncbi:hypothetical protein DFH09DRAFT_1366115 [Mycena vulgaris]|nr:hypothetical protein DFH09DRAFT_1366115 [Mycena vulgaris]
MPFWRGTRLVLFGLGLSGTQTATYVTRPTFSLELLEALRAPSTSRQAQPQTRCALGLHSLHREADRQRRRYQHSSSCPMTTTTENLPPLANGPANCRRRTSISGRRASKVEASPPLPTVDDLEHVLIDNDIVAEVVTRCKLRAYAAQWRGVSALEPAPPPRRRRRVSAVTSLWASGALTFLSYLHSASSLLPAPTSQRPHTSSHSLPGLFGAWSSSSVTAALLMLVDAFPAHGHGVSVFAASSAYRTRRPFFAIQDEPPTWPGADDDEMGLESISDPEETEDAAVDDGDVSSAASTFSRTRVHANSATPPRAPSTGKTTLSRTSPRFLAPALTLAVLGSCHQGYPEGCDGFVDGFVDAGGEVDVEDD